jgi:PAS domain S-box-containing protein
MEAPAAKTSILIVEDESIVALDMRGRLTEMGYAVVGIAASGEAALALADQKRPDLVLMDIKLQGDLDGVDTAELLRKTQDIPIIFITAFADNRTLSRAKINQAFGYILKPFQEREVLISIEMALYKHRLERNLRESKEWLDGTLNAISDSIIALDPEGRVVFINRAAETLLGVSEETVRGRSVADVCTFADDPSLAEIAANYRVRRESTRDSQWLLMSAPEPRRPVEVIRTGIQGPNERVAGSVIAVRDISELVAAESARSRLSAIVANSYDAIISLDSSLRIESWNLGAELIYGYGSQEMIGSDIGALIPDDRERSHLKELASFTLAGKDIGRFETHRRCRSGKIIAVSVSLSPLRDSQGKVSQIACIERDISAEKEYEASLVQAKLNAEEVSRVKSEFLSNMSHELRTPLNSIIGMVEMSRDVSVSDEQREYLEIARQSADNLLFLINSILDFSKIEVGKMRLHSNVFDPVDAAEECLEELSVQAARKGLSLAFRSDPAIPPQVFGDSRRFKQILTNLLSNGIKFTERGRVRVDLALAAPASADSVVLSLGVSDTGIGISADRLEQIWESFTQLDGSSTRAFGGTGLGLSIVKSLAELMGGAVSVKSELGVGSVFEASIPFSLPEGEQVLPAHAPVPPLSVVLLGISSPEEAAILEELLRSWGCEPRVFSSAVPLVEALQEGGPLGSPRLAIIDENLSDRAALFSCSADEACRAALQDRLAVLVSLGFRDDPGWRTLSATSRFLFKPVRRKLLIEILAKGSTAEQAGFPSELPAAVQRPRRSPGQSEDDREGYPEAVLDEIDSSPEISAVLSRFLSTLSSSDANDFIRLEGAATACRQELEDRGAVALPRAILKIILASRREDSAAVLAESAKLRSACAGAAGPSTKRREP